MKFLRPLLFILSSLTLFTSHPALALPQTHCPLPSSLQPKTLTTLPFDQIELTADYSFVTHRQWFQFEGDVTLQQNDYYLAADSATFNQQDKRLLAQGNIRFQQQDLLVNGRSARLHLLDKTGYINSAQYYYPEINARGNAQALFLSPNVAKLSEASYTTCDDTDPFWQIRAQAITLDKTNNLVSAYNLSLRIKQWPVLYLPYISFPLQGRQSGLLMPTIVSTSQGLKEIGIPYYINLAPHHDMTITPKWFPKRGLQWGTEFRYLNKKNRGTLAGEYLPNDQQTDRNRSHIFWQHDMQIGQYATLQADITQVSDTNYFRNFGNTLSNTSQSILERKITTRLTYGNSSLWGLVQNFQPLEKNMAKPYQRLPQFNFTTFNQYQLSQYQSIDLDFYSQFTHFEHDETVDGQRFIAEPTLTWSYEKIAGFFKPKLLLRYAKYRVGKFNASETPPGFFIPRYALDSGLFFERFLPHSTQTLEPRLHFLYTPKRSQNHLPQFDSARKEMNIRQLFDTRLYSGEDRVADMQRITLGLTSRIIEHHRGNNGGGNGGEKIKIALASSYYLRPQTTTLAGETPIQNKQIQSTAELSTQLNANFSTNTKIFWDRVDPFNNKLLIQLNHQQHTNILNFAYHFRHQQTNQIATSALWKLNPQWRIVGHWNYSLRTQRTQENILGFEYNSCCWSVGIVYRELNRGIAAKNDISFALQFELKGFTSLGQNLEQRFNQEILGYTPEK